MSTFLTSLFLALGAIVSMFIIWRSLREDYKESQIFSFSFLVIIGALTGYFLASSLLPGLKFWITVGSGALFGILRVHRLAMRFFEVTEAIVPAFFVYLLFVQIIILPKNIASNPWFLAEPVLVILSLATFYFLSLNYRQFLWYPSGKIGFASLTSLSLFFAIRAILAQFAPFVLLESSGIIDIIAGVAVSIFSLVGLYIRSGRSIRKDIKR